MLAAEWSSPEVIVAGIAVVIALFALGVSVVAIKVQWATAREQAGITARQNELQIVLNSHVTDVERRRFTIELWTRMESIQHIDPNDPAPAIVMRNLDILELLAVCWTADIVDRQMVVIAFGQLFMEIIRETRAIQQGIGGGGRNRTGSEILEDRPILSECLSDIEARVRQQGLARLEKHAK